MTPPTEQEGFCITDHKGFRMRFKNGWSISVQWGPGNYTEPRDFKEPYDGPDKSRFYAKRKAEIAIFNPAGDFAAPKEWHDQVLGYVDPDEVLRWMNWTAKRPT
jgi:hypothetical protein